MPTRMRRFAGICDPARFAGTTDRFALPDVLRGVAVTAMLIAHAAPFLPTVPREVRFLMGNVSDLASPLFALVMGMSAQILFTRTHPGDRPRVVLRQVIRASVLIGLGLWMTTWGTWVAIVLSYLGVLLLVGTPLILLPTRWVVSLTIIVACASSPVNAWARTELMWVYTEPSGAAATVSSWLVLGSAYRLTNLLPFFLLGALLWRRPVARRRFWLLGALAVAAYLVSPLCKHLQGVESFASGSYPDTLHDAGLVLLTYVVARGLTESRGRVLLVSRPLVAAVRSIGILALSVYLLHVASLALLAPPGVRPAENEYVAWFAVVGGVLVGGVAWQRTIGTGPAEALVHAVTSLVPRRASVEATSLPSHS